MMKNYPKIDINNLSTEKGYYKKSTLITKGFIQKNQENTIFVPRKEKKITMSLFQNGKKKNNGFFLEIIFHGLNYSAKRLKLNRKTFMIDVHKSEIFINKEPLTTISKSRIYKRRLVFFSYDQQHLKTVENYLKNLKKPNSYTGKGLFSRLDIYKIKKVQKKK